jgi:hypothetical protein
MRRAMGMPKREISRKSPILNGFWLNSGFSKLQLHGRKLEKEVRFRNFPRDGYIREIPDRIPGPELKQRRSEHQKFYNYERLTSMHGNADSEFRITFPAI